MSELTKQELEAIAAAGAEKAVTDVLQKLGIDPADFREVQADQAHLRKQRLASEQIGKLAARALVTIFFTGLCSLIVLGLKDFFFTQVIANSIRAAAMNGFFKQPTLGDLI